MAAIAGKVRRATGAEVSAHDVYEAVEVIRAAFARQGWTQYQLALAAGVSPGTLSRWLSGEVSRPNTATLARVARAMRLRLAVVSAP